MSAMSNREPQEALVGKFFERRNAQLFEGVRHGRAVIANRMAAAGTLQSGGFVSAVTSAFAGGFEAFAHGLIKDTFDLLSRSGLAVDGDVASWIKARLDPFFEIAATNMRSEAAQGWVLPDELRESVDRGMTKSLAENHQLLIQFCKPLIGCGVPATVLAVVETR